MTAWSLVYEGYAPDQEGLREALCTLGNGYFATRGAAPDCVADDVHHPGTYLAGGYDRAATEIHGREIVNEDLVNLPNWLPLSFRVEEGDWIDVDGVEILDYRQELNLADGLLLRTLRFRDEAGRTTRWTERRLVSMAQPHLAALCVEIAPEDWEGDIEIRSGLDGRVANDGVERYRELEGRHLDVLEAARIGEDRILLRTRTRQSRLEVAQVARTRVHAGEAGFEPVEAERGIEDRVGWIAELVPVHVGPEHPARVEKVAVLYTSRDKAISEAALEASKDAADAREFDGLLDDHRRAWHHLWDSFDLELELDADNGRDGGSEAQQRLRVHTFHLLQTVSPHSTDLDVGVPARG